MHAISSHSARRTIVLAALMCSLLLAAANPVSAGEEEGEEHEEMLPHTRALRAVFGPLSNPYTPPQEKKPLCLSNFFTYGWTQGWEHGEWGPKEAPRFRLMRIKQAFWERELRLTYAYADDAEGGEAHEQELEFELELPISRRFMIEFEGPIEGLKEKGEDWTHGFGGLKVIPQVMLAETDDASFSGGVEVKTPTGRDDFGGDQTAVMPYLAYWQDLGGRVGLHTFAGTNFQIDEFGPEEADSVFEYGVAPSLTLTRKHRPWLGNFTVFGEVNGEVDIGAADNGHRVTFLPGVRWMLLEETWLAVGEEFPISGDQAFDHKFWVSIYMDF